MTLTAEQVRQAVINTQQRPVNNSVRIKQAMDNEKVKSKEVRYGKL